MSKEDLYEDVKKAVKDPNSMDAFAWIELVKDSILGAEKFRGMPGGDKKACVVYVLSRCAQELVTDEAQKKKLSDFCKDWLPIVIDSIVWAFNNRSKFVSCWKITFPCCFKCCKS